MRAGSQFPQLSGNFVGRSRELEWLNEKVVKRRRNSTPIIITGNPGIGKTALIKNFLSTPRRINLYESLWFNLLNSPNVEENLDVVTQSLRSAHGFEPTIVVLDNAEQFDDSQLDKAINRIFNYKRVKHLIISTRHKPDIRNATFLHLEGLRQEDIKLMLGKYIKDEQVFEQVSRIVDVSHGIPVAISLIAELLEQHDTGILYRVLSGKLYDVSETTTQSQIIQVIKPSFISAQEKLVLRLQKQPENLFSISPRNFEEALAEILNDMGFEVELTKATRDGGIDILAYQETPIGKRLCLVDAKRYRQTHKVGVALVRTLYGTLCDYQANSAMLVTTSTFTKDAKAFQEKHSYQLSLKDYSDVASWLEKYRRRES